MKPVLLALLLLPAATAGCGNRPGPVGDPPELPVVAGLRVAGVEPRHVAVTVEAVGTVRPRAHAAVSARITAQVVAVHAREGDRVRSGQPLADLDDREARARVAQAAAALAAASAGLGEARSAAAAADRAVDASRARRKLAQSSQGRVIALLARKAATNLERDEAQARLSESAAETEQAEASKGAAGSRALQARARIGQAEAEVAAARIGSEFTHLAAPIAGVVSARTAEIGSLASPGLALFIVEQESYRAECQIDESSAASLRQGQPAKVTVGALGVVLDGSITELVPAADPASRTFTVKVDLPSSSGLRSGLYCKARFVTGERKQLAVPVAAVLVRGQLERVMAVDETGVARARLVKTGAENDGLVEILSGLSPGERIVVEGTERATDPCRVQQ